MKIKFLKLFTSDIPSQIQFYEGVLGLTLKKVSRENFSIQVGYSTLEFEQSTNATPYHIAFHIPALEEEVAMVWLEKRLELLKSKEQKIIDFPAWKAKSLYFYDADKNILEFISRTDLFLKKQVGFSADSICGISEIGLATSDVKSKFDFLRRQFALTKFTGDFHQFCATGDDEGLFIIINKEQKTWIPTGDQAFASPFEIEILTQNNIFGASFKHDSLTLL